MSDDLLAAELAAIRSRAAWEQQVAPHSAGEPPGCAEDISRLLAALEAVLGLHRPDCEMGVDALWCAHCGVAINWPCPTMQAITRALLGEAATADA